MRTNAILLLAALAMIGVAYQQNHLVVTVDGKAVEFKGSQPQTVKGRVMVPLRGVFESIGAYVEYDSANRIITARKNSEVVELRLGERIAKKNGAEIELDVEPATLGGRTMVPLRFIAEAMGSKVGFDKANNRVSITTEPAAPEVTNGQ